MADERIGLARASRCNVEGTFLHLHDGMGLNRDAAIERVRRKEDVASHGFVVR
jgi:hypothetical protein